jgi:hypothetical protein
MPDALSSDSLSTSIYSLSLIGCSILERLLGDIVNPGNSIDVSERRQSRLIQKQILLDPTLQDTLGDDMVIKLSILSCSV